MPDQHTEDFTQAHAHDAIRHTLAKLDALRARAAQALTEDYRPTHTDDDAAVQRALSSAGDACAFAAGVLAYTFASTASTSEPGSPLAPATPAPQGDHS